MQTVERVVGILTEMADAPDGLSLTEIAKRVGLSPATCYRLLKSLMASHLIERDPASKRFHPGIGLIRLAASVSPSAGLEKSVDMTLVALRDRWQECFYFSALVDGEVVCIASVETTDPNRLSAHVRVGRRLALHGSASAKVVVSFRPLPERDRLVEAVEPLEAFTKFTLTDPVRVKADLEESRGRGYAICDQEMEIGMYALAVAVSDVNGDVTRSLGVVGPRDRILGAMDEGLLDDLRTSASYLSGGREPVVPDSAERVS